MLCVNRSIIDIKRAFIRYQVLFYSKFHYKFNYIEYFWGNGKNQTRRYCKYIIKELKEDISQALSQIKGSTILKHYNNCRKKMDLYRENI